MLVSLHSFTPVYAGIARPWHIGTLYHRDTRLPPLLLKALRAEGDLVVGDNEPYAVSDATDYTHSRACRSARADQYRNRDPAGSDRGQAGRKQWADGWRGFLARSKRRCAAEKLI